MNESVRIFSTTAILAFVANLIVVYLWNIGEVLSWPGAFFQAAVMAVAIGTSTTVALRWQKRRR